MNAVTWSFTDGHWWYSKSAAGSVVAAGEEPLR